MPNNKKVTDVLEKVKKGIIEKDKFFKKKDKFKSYIRSLLNPVKQKEGDNYLLILRRYNSFTPALPRYQIEPLEEVKGGGCFLYWQGKGIAIDPGFNFIQNLEEAGLSIGNIDAVILTHGHNDHYIDLDPILTLIYQYNELNKNIIFGNQAYSVKNYPAALESYKTALEIDPTNEIAKIGSYICISILTDRAEGEIFKESLTNLDKKIAELKGELPVPLKKIDIFLARSAQKTVDSFIPLNLDQIENVYLLNPGLKRNCPDYFFDLYAVHAKHKDLYSKNHCIGLRFTLKQKGEEDFHLGITSDTGYYQAYTKLNGRIASKELAEEFYQCSVLVAHIGSMKRHEFAWLKEPDNTKDTNLTRYLYENHLGILGLAKLASELSPDTLELIVVSEYGEEMKDCRIELTQILNDVFQQPVFRSGDVGLKISLTKPAKIIIANVPELPANVKEDYGSKKEIIYYV